MKNKAEKKDNTKKMLVALLVCICILGVAFTKEAQAENDCEKICKSYEKNQNDAGCFKRCARIAYETMSYFVKKCNREICKVDGSGGAKDKGAESCMLVCDDVAAKLFNWAD